MPEYTCKDCGRGIKGGHSRCRKCYLGRSKRSVAAKLEARRIREELADARNAFLGLKQYIETGTIEVLPEIQCPVRRCGKMFAPTRTTNGRLRKTCSEDCRVAYLRQCRKKLPDDTSEIVDMYLNREMTGPEIAKVYGVEHHAIYKALERAGIKRITAGASNRKTCRVEGCTDPIYKIKHTNNGSYYGSLCLYHWTIHRRAINRKINRKNRRVPIEKQQIVIDPTCATEQERKDYLCLQQGKALLRQTRKTLKNRKPLSPEVSQ